MAMTYNSKEKPTVFIVDDEFAMRDSLSLLVETMGYTAKCFSAAEEFLAFSSAHDLSGRVCLIADIQMPKLNGIDMLKRLNAAKIKIPVVIITGHGDCVLRQQVEQLGAVAFLEKPFPSAQLQDVLVGILKPDAEQENAA